MTLMMGICVFILEHILEIPRILEKKLAFFQANVIYKGVTCIRDHVHIFKIRTYLSFFQSYS